MKKMILAAAAVLMATGAWAQDTAYRYENYVQVNGRAEREIVPDEIYVRIVIDENEMKVKQTVEKLEKDMIAALKKAGVDTEKDLKVENMLSSYKDYFLNRNKARTTASYELKVNSSQTLGRVYQAVESVGISNMNIVRIGHSNLRGIQNEVRLEAVKNAQELARSLAEALGQKAGRAVFIVDYNNDPYIPAPVAKADMLYASRAANDEAAYETPLEFKNIKLTHNLTAKFVLE